MPEGIKYSPGDLIRYRNQFWIIIDVFTVEHESYGGMIFEILKLDGINKNSRNFIKNNCALINCINR